MVTTQVLLAAVGVLALILCNLTSADDLEYGPLRCNAEAAVDIDTDVCLTTAVGLSALLSALPDPADASAPLVVPCGRCAVVDHVDGATLTIAGGLVVLGRLHFPPSANVTVRTPGVVVQGAWSMAAPAAGNTVTVALYGREERTLYPHDLCCAGEDASCDADCAHKRGIGSQSFVVAGGKLDIRAIDDTCASWTKLADAHMSSLPHSLVVDTPFAACLRPGDELLVTSDTHRADDASTVTVNAVDAASGEIFLDEPLPRVLPTLAGPYEPLFAVEVALLRRDVVFFSEPDPADPLIGGHSMIFHTPRIPQTIQGVRFENFGQAGVLGRYPIHFHKSGESASLVSKNVIVHSHQRCVFIHDTNNVTIDDNVAFDTAGHCYATETGDERYNTFSRNLGASTRLLHRSGNGESDDPEDGGHFHQASTFWFRNMENTFVGNVAAGSEDIGFWIEMKDRNGNQLHNGAFKDNVAHSAKQGLLTYNRGWQPALPAVIDAFHSYKNTEGYKFHITGNLKIINSVIADCAFGIRYGVFNSGVTLENSTIVALSEDDEKRRGLSCKWRFAGIRPTFNDKPERFGAIVLDNVEFVNFQCNVHTIEYYKDKQLELDMGDPVVTHNVKFTNSLEKNRPKLDECSTELWSQVFMEDYDAVLGPDGKGRGFLIAHNERMTAFLPNTSCEVVPYDDNHCTAFCEGVCIRLVHLLPRTGNIESDKYSHVVLTNEEGTSHTYSIYGNGKAVLVLPPGQYHADFLDVDGNSVALDALAVETFRTPRCQDYVSASDFRFDTPSPVASPSGLPSMSNSPTFEFYYLPVGPDLKCPSDDRLFRVESATFDDCYQRCYDEPTCEYFAHSTDALCVGCDSNAILSDHPGFQAYHLAAFQFFRPVASNMKCPYGDSTRLFELTENLEGCYDICYDQPTCRIFSHDAVSGDCMGCSQGIESLDDHQGFNAYELVELQDFPYELSALDAKCPSANRVGSRAKTDTRQGCYELCREENGCVVFTYGDQSDDYSSRQHGLCFLCDSADGLDNHKGLNSYEM